MFRFNVVQLLLTATLLASQCQSANLEEIAQAHKRQVEKLNHFKAELETTSAKTGKLLLTATWIQSSGFERIIRKRNTNSQPFYHADALYGGGRKKFFCINDSRNLPFIRLSDQEGARASDFVHDGQTAGTSVMLDLLFHFRLSRQFGPWHLESLSSFIADANSKEVKAQTDGIVKTRFTFKNPKKPTSVELWFSPDHGYHIVRSEQWYSENEMGIRTTLGNFTELSKGAYFPRRVEQTWLRGKTRTEFMQEVTIVKKLTTKFDKEDQLGFRFPPELIVHRQTPNGSRWVYYDVDGKQSGEFTSTVDIIELVGPDFE